MSGVVGATNVSTAVLPGGRPVPVAPARAGASLLPSPVGIDIDAALAEIMKLSSAMNEAQTKSSTAQAETRSAARKAAADRRNEMLTAAIEAARKAAEEKDEGGLFDVITDNLGPIGLVGLVVGGAFLVAADLTAHATGLEDDKLDVADAAGLGCMLAGPIGVAVHAAQLCVKKFGPDEIQEALDNGPTIKDADVRKANKIALAVTQAQLALAATAASGGTAAPAVVAMVGVAVSTTTQILQETGALGTMFGEDAKWVALGGTLVGAGLSIGGGIAVAAKGGWAEAEKITSAIEKAKVTAEAVHNVNQGIHNLRSAEYQHEADNLQVGAKQQKHVVEFLDRMIDDIIDDLKDLQESTRKTSELCQSISETRNQTILLAGNLKG